jgi:hypothetical protein
MRLTLNDASAVPALVSALRAAGRPVALAGPNTLEVELRTGERPADRARAVTELVFFARAWEAAHPGVRISPAAA